MNLNKCNKVVDRKKNVQYSVIGDKGDELC